MSKTLYEVIGVNQNANTKDIESKCIELGKKYHPSSNPDDLDAAIIYKEVMLAYSTLRDSGRRAQYDATIKNNQSSTQSRDNLSKSSANQDSNSKPNVAKREVSLSLAVAVIFVPYIASWLLLRKGYSQKARVLGFGWLVVVVLICTSINNKSVETGTPAEIQARREVREGVERQNQQIAGFNEKQKSSANRVMGAWKGAVEEILIDPNSADFKDVVFVTAVSGTQFACGKVNSKNRLGGYTGYKRFITAGLKEYTFIDGEKDGFNEYWKQVCVEGSKF